MAFLRLSGSEHDLTLAAASAKEKPEHQMRPDRFGQPGNRVSYEFFWERSTLKSPPASLRTGGSRRARMSVFCP